MRSDEVRSQKKEDHERMVKQTKKSNGFAYSVGTVFLVMMCVILVWAAVGMGMNMGFIPEHDFGYSWFNAKLYPLF